jgi:hypothetical protein
MEGSMGGRIWGADRVEGFAKLALGVEVVFVEVASRDTNGTTGKGRTGTIRIMENNSTSGTT